MSLINRILAVLLAHGAIDLARELVATWGRATPTGDDPSPEECDDPLVEEAIFDRLTSDPKWCLPRRHAGWCD